ncbi:MAG: InlB B-repeat-containing protein, partial [Erysipelotrichaceae bacterium]|nr:InlB B-repeat-containing protein [Erysipelotrichaceae bacterium]
NVLIKIPVDFGNNADEYDPLDDLEEMNDEVYNQHEHVWDEGVIIKEPTCGEFGEKLHTCKDDENHIWIEYIDTLEHDWSDWEITKEPKGDEPGERRRVCKNDPTHVEVEIYPKPEDGCILTFDYGDGYVGEVTGVQEFRVKIGTELTIPDGPVKEGYKFLYWQGSEYHPGDKYIVEGSHTFTAVYEKEQNPLSPQTGDDSNLYLWMALSLTSTCCFCYIISRKRKAAYTN